MKNNGYIALISAIIISLILMLIVLGTSQVGFNSRFNSLDSEFKERSQILAESCLDHAILTLHLDDLYSTTTPETVSVPPDQCQVICIGKDWPKIIAVQAKPNDVYTNLVIEIKNFYQLDSPTTWREVPNFKSSACS